MYSMFHLCETTIVTFCYTFLSTDAVWRLQEATYGTESGWLDAGHWERWLKQLRDDRLRRRQDAAQDVSWDHRICAQHKQIPDPGDLSGDFELPVGSDGAVDWPESVWDGWFSHSPTGASLPQSLHPQSLPAWDPSQDLCHTPRLLPQEDGGESYHSTVEPQ